MKSNALWGTQTRRVALGASIVAAACMLLTAGAAQAQATSRPAAAGAASQSRPATSTASKPATAPATQPSAEPFDSELPAPLLRMLALGLIVLVGWVCIRIARPEKVSLAASPGRPCKLTPVHVLALLVLFYLPQVLIGAIYKELGRPVPLNWIPASAIISQALLIIGCVVMAMLTFKFGARTGLGLNLRHPLADTVRGLVGFLAALPVVFGLLLGMYALLTWMMQMGYLHDVIRTNEMLVLLHNADTPRIAMIVISAVVMAPLAEEIFFRGMTQSMLKQYIKPWPAIICASVFFGLLHAPYWQDVVSLIALGIILGYNYERTGRLIAPIILHATFNGVMIFMQLTKTG